MIEIKSKWVWQELINTSHQPAQWIIQTKHVLKQENLEITGGAGVETIKVNGLVGFVDQFVSGS